MTLAEARGKVMQRALTEKEPRCPCCGQMAKVYRRKLYSTMAHDLIRLYQAGAGSDWVHVPSVLGYNGGDIIKCSYWDLIEEESVRRPDGGRAGYWRLTEDGVEFANRRAKIRKYAIVYNGRCLALEGPYVDIVDCLGEKFDYSRLIAGS